MEEEDENVTLVKYLKLNDGKNHPISDIQNRENVNVFANNVKNSVNLIEEYNEFQHELKKTLVIDINAIPYSPIN